MKLLTKFTYIMLTCAMLLSCGAVCAAATEATEPDVVSTDDFDYILVDGYAFITAYRGDGNSVIIPSLLDGYPVDAVGGSVFRDRTDIIRVEFMEGVTNIGDYAFMGCTALEEVILPHSLRSIGRAAFEGCTALYRVDIGRELLNIGIRAFSGCSALDGIYLPENMQYVDELAFAGCTSLRHMVVTSLTLTLDEGAFTDTSGIVVYAPSGAAVHSNAVGYSPVVAAGAEALSLKTTVGGLMITDVTTDAAAIIVPENAGGTIVALGKDAMAKLVDLRAVYLPDTVTSIGESAFRGDISLRYVRLPRSLTVSLGKEVFYGCSLLSRIYIPEGVETIGMDCFGGCAALERVTFPSTLNRIQAGAFYGCSALSALVFWGDTPECAFLDGSEQDVSFGGIPATARIYTDAARDWDSVWYPNGKKYPGLTVTSRSYDCFYIEVILIPVSCAADGLSTLACPDCGDSFTRTYPKTEHDFVSLGISNGAETYRCTACTANYTVKRLEIADVTAELDRAKSGAEMIQKVTVVFRGVTLTEGVDYTYSVEYLRECSRLMLTVTGTGDFAGSTTVAYSSLTGNQLSTYTLTVIGDASGGGEYYRDDIVTIVPNQTAPQGMVAVWTVEGASFRRATEAKAVIEMPAKDVTVTLTYEKAPETEPSVTTPPVTEPPITEPPVTTPPVTEPPVTTPPVTQPPETQPFDDSDIARGYISRAVILTAILAVSFAGFVVMCVFMFKKDAKSK